MLIVRQLWSSLKIGCGYLKVLPQLIIGAWKIAKLPQPVVSVFGGSRLKKNSPAVRQAEELSRCLVMHDISVITGGGKGIMEAANCGAFRKDAHSIHTMGIGVKGIVAKEPINQCVREHIMTDYFALRKYLLIHYSFAYVIFPGGFGTIDEFAEVLTLMQTEKLTVAPVILIGVEYWKFFIMWLKTAVKEGLITQKHVEYITVTDDITEAVAILVEYCQRCQSDKK